MNVQDEWLDSDGGVGCVVTGKGLTEIGAAQAVEGAKIGRAGGPVQLLIRASGGGPESVALGPVHDVQSFLISPQTGPFTTLCEKDINTQGVVWIPAKRPDASSAVAVSTSPPEPQILVQDVGPLSLADWTPQMDRSVAHSQVFVAAPRPSDGGTYTLLDRLPATCSGLRVLVPDRSLLSMPGFASVAVKYDYIVMTTQDSRSLPGGTDDAAQNALLLRHLLGDHKWLTIVDQRGDGYHWDGYSWTKVEPIDRPTGTWFPEVFATAYGIGTVFLNLSSWAAVQFAWQSTVYASFDDRPRVTLPWPAA